MMKIGMLTSGGDCQALISLLQLVIGLGEAGR